jgi:hypothetical protein
VSFRRAMALAYREFARQCNADWLESPHMSARLCSAHERIRDLRDLLMLSDRAMLGTR